MSSLAEIRAGLATNLAAVAGVQVSAYVMASPTPPGLQIIPPGVEYDKAFHRGFDQWMFVIQGFVALTTDRGPQVVLDAMCAPSGSGSVKTAIESDRTLGGKVSDLWVESQSPGRVVDPGGTGGGPMLLVEWTVRVLS